MRVLGLVVVYLIGSIPVGFLISRMIESLVAENDGYRHDDPRFSDCERGNAHSHLRAALLGRSVAVGISGGELSLGRFQSILFAELDGPRPRSIDVQIMASLGPFFVGHVLWQSPGR